MSAELFIASLLRVAKEDLEGARLLRSRGNRNAVYLCEQAAGKIIRAVLTSEGAHANIRHDLKGMVDLVPDANPIKPLPREIEPLSAHATSYRYPTVSGRIAASPSPATVDEAVTKVEAALRMAIGRFGVDPSTPHTPASSPSPIR